jgi:uncharacterized protein (TIGR00725 family)
MIIAVVGGDASSDPSDEALAQAEAVGAEIARRGCVLICGGRGGVMEAACRGASEAGGLTVGVLPGRDRSGMNPYVQVPILTGLGEARNAIIPITADAVIAIDGEYGTLSEIAHALINGKPLIGLGTWHLSKDGVEEGSIIRADDALEAVRLAVEAADGNDGVKRLPWDGGTASGARDG